MKSLGGLLKKELDVGDNDSAAYREDMARCNSNLAPIIKGKGWDILDSQFWFRAVQDEHREGKINFHAVARSSGKYSKFD